MVGGVQRRAETDLNEISELHGSSGQTEKDVLPVRRHIRNSNNTHENLLYWRIFDIKVISTI